MKVVSLLPSATEIVYALGAGDLLVAVTFECDTPPSARTDHAVVVGGRDTSAMSPAAIEDYVASQVAAGADLYTLDRGALARLDPDLIITQDLCRVCALPSGEVDAALTYLGCRADVLSLDPYRLGDVLASIVEVAVHLGVLDQGRELVARLDARLERVAAAVDGRPRPRVAVVEWVDPPYRAGHWIPDQVGAAGGHPVVAAAGARSTRTTWEEYVQARPDVVLVAPCGFGLDGACEQAEVVAAALPGLPVWAVDGNAIVVRPGPRLVDGVETIAGVLHPGTFAVDPARARRVA